MRSYENNIYVELSDNYFGTPPPLNAHMGLEYIAERSAINYLRAPLPGGLDVDLNEALVAVGHEAGGLVGAEGQGSQTGLLVGRQLREHTLFLKV